MIGAETGKRTRKPGRPRDQAKLAAILDASWQLFLAHGVEAVSIDRIAAAAGVAKMTVYASFSDKRALFHAGVLRETQRIEAAQQQGMAAAGDGSLRGVLVAFGTALITFLHSRTAVDFYGSLAGELRRDPALARLFHDAGPGRTLANLAAILGGPMASDLAIADPKGAAETLFGMWQGSSNFRLMLGIDPPGAGPAVVARVEQMVDQFLAGMVAARDQALAGAAAPDGNVIGAASLDAVPGKR
jgi:TetR/AcrR family transcriptional repressor of mexJK operon